MHQNDRRLTFTSQRDKILIKKNTLKNNKHTPHFLTLHAKSPLCVVYVRPKRQTHCGLQQYWHEVTLRPIYQNHGLISKKYPQSSEFSLVKGRKKSTYLYLLSIASTLKMLLPLIIIIIIMKIITITMTNNNKKKIMITIITPNDKLIKTIFHQKV